jgi:hypothetical protein
MAHKQFAEPKRHPGGRASDRHRRIQPRATAPRGRRGGRHSRGCALQQSVLAPAANRQTTTGCTTPPLQFAKRPYEVSSPSILLLPVRLEARRWLQRARARARAAALMRHGVQLAEQVRARLSCAATWCTRGEASRTDPGDSCTLCGPRLMCSACSASQRLGIVHGYTRVWCAALRQAKDAQLSPESRCRAARQLMRAAPAPRRGAPAPGRSGRGKWRRRPYTHASGQSACAQPGGTNETHSRAPRAVHL